jgi:hypothetical protein
MRRYQNAWMKKRRDAAVAAMGGKCARCGAAERLEVDHIDPSTKIAHSIWSWAADRRAAELAKCQLLCRPCHITKSADERRRPCGTTARYRAGCRCEPCRQAERVRRAPKIAQRSALRAARRAGTVLP